MPRTRIFLGGLLAGLLLVSVAMAQPAVALFYGPNPPLDELKAFDVVVIDPDQSGVDPASYNRTDSQLFAYVSVGEVRPERPYFHRIPSTWLKDRNQNWGSTIVDQSSAGWPAFFCDQVIAPLWKKGYRGFFLDTLDSYQLIAKTADDKARQEEGLKAVIREIKRRWPDARLILNRGFEILPDIHQDVWMVAAESLFRSWDAGAKTFTEVSDSDRTWLLNQLHKVQNDYHLPVLVIDYVPLNQRQQARETAQKIRDAGFIPYVTVPDLDAMGLGSIEVIPRKVMVIYNPHEAEDLFYADAVRFLGMPFAYLGLTPEYFPVDKPLPAFSLRGRYAGVVTWLNDDAADRGPYMKWVMKQIDDGVPVAFISHFGFNADPMAYAKLDLGFTEHPPSQDLSLQKPDPIMGFELKPLPKAEGLPPVYLQNKGRALLTLTGNSNDKLTPAAIMPWGGYVMAPYTIGEIGSMDGSERWYFNPVAFLAAALQLDSQVPVPDVTTEMGLRQLMVHIDGDGFANKAERPGYPFAGRVLVDEVLKRYQIPTTLSVIEGEVGATGLYPDISPKLEDIVRDAFALPWVELASHTYSHPFRWSEEQTRAMARRSKPSSDPDYLPIKGYVLNVDREISGSVSYINSRLAPPGKRVKVILWPGDCVPTPEALALSYKDGLLNMNGGDTVITRSHDSWTNIAGLGFWKDGYFQIFAPNENENVYTNLWSGPFYGYERVIETFQMTEQPYRFKPIDIYYHPYAVTKTASLAALHKVYQWALRQPTNPEYASDYIKKVLDYNHVVVARLPGGFRIRGDGALRTVRLPESGADVDLAHSPRVAGIAPGPHARYVSLADGNADVQMASQPGRLPYIQTSNARITNFLRTPEGIDFGLSGYVPLRLAFNQAQSCQLYDGNTLLHPDSRVGGQLQYELSAHESRTLRLACQA